MNPSADLDLQRLRPLLAKPRISLVTSHPDAEVARLRTLITDHVQIDGRSALEAVLSRLAQVRPSATVAPKTLDLIGHSTPDGLLRLGDWTLDADSSTVTAFFRGIADLDLLPRLGVTAVRLLGCSTASSTRARTTLKILSEVLGLEVFGTTSPIYSLHYDADGFGHQWRFLLSAASDEPQKFGTEGRTAPPAPRALDIDSLPLVPLARGMRSCGRFLVAGEDARAILELVDRYQGAQMPGLLAIPSHELALPAHREGHCHIAEVILNGHFLRVYPDGESQPGIVYPVVAPHRLLALVSRLPMV